MCLVCSVFTHQRAILDLGQKLQTAEQFVPEGLTVMSGWDWRMFGIQKSASELTPCDACPPIPATGTPRRNARMGVSFHCPWIRLLCLSQTHVGLCKQRNSVVNVKEASTGCFVMLEITSVRTRSEPGKSEIGLRENSRKIINIPTNLPGEGIFIPVWAQTPSKLTTLPFICLFFNWTVFKMSFFSVLPAPHGKQVRVFQTSSE